MGDSDLTYLMEQATELMGRGFNLKQSFEIATAEAGWIARMSFETFNTNIERHRRAFLQARDTGLDATKLQNVATHLSRLVQKGVPGVGMLAFHARLLKARALGYLAPKAIEVATGSGTPAFISLLGAIAVLGAIAGGVYMAANWGEPESEPVVPGKKMETAFVPIRVNGAILSVRTKGAIETGLRSSRFRNGGVGTDMAKIDELGPPTSLEDATRRIADLIVPGSLRGHPLAPGSLFAKVGGKSFTVDDWGSVDVELLRSLVNE